MLRISLLAIFLVITSFATKADEIVVGVETGEFKPYYETVGGEYKGLGRELLDRYASDLGHTIVYKPMDIPTLTKALVGEKIDLKFPAHLDWNMHLKNNKIILYSDPTLPYLDGTMVVDRHYEGGVNKVRKIGSIVGFAPQAYRYWVENDELQFVFVSNVEELLDLVKGGQVRGVYSSIHVLKEYLSTHPNAIGERGLKFDRTLPHTYSYYRIASAHRKDLIREFNIWLDHNQAFVDSLLKKYKIQ